ncbi:MAG: hypothetical protein ABW167_16820 [Baekduia sp.]
MHRFILGTSRRQLLAAGATAAAGLVATATAPQARAALPLAKPAGDDAVAPDDFARQVTVGSRAGALKVGRELESLVGGAYLGGVAASTDYGTRLLLGRLLALCAGHNAILTRWAGRAAAGLPSPIDLDAAGLRLDAYLKEPTS